MKSIPYSSCKIAPDEFIRCRHCGLSATQRPLDAEGFCCHACAIIYTTLHEVGAQDFYHYRDLGKTPSAEGQVTTPAQRSSWQEIATPTSSSYLYMNDPGFTENFSRKVGELIEVRLYLDGIHCAACLWLLERLQRFIPGVIHSKLSLVTGIICITYRPDKVTLSTICTWLNKVGYPPYPPDASSLAAAQASTFKSLITRLGVAGFCVGNIMILTTSLYQGDITGIESSFRGLFATASAILCVPVVTYCAWPFYQAAYRGLFQRPLPLDLPLALSIAGGFLLSLWSLLSDPTPTLYFDSIAVVVFFLLISRLVQRSILDRSRRQARLAAHLLPLAARVVEDGVEEERSLYTIKTGTIIRIPAGERVPVDGEIIVGQSSVDESILTGEALPKQLNIGDRVNAGTLNLSSPLTVTALATGSETRIGKILTSLELSDRDATHTTLVEKISGWFTFTVLILALLAIQLAWPYGVSEVVRRLMALFVIACPCALGLAAPACRCVAIARASKLGILVRGTTTFERLAKAGAVFFDKTGTLTAGIVGAKFVTPRCSGVTNDQLSTLDAQVLRKIISATPSHPICKGIGVWLTEKYPNLPPRSLDKIKYHPSNGLEAWLNDAHYLLGSRRWIKNQTTPIIGLEQWQPASGTEAFFIREGEIIGQFQLSDSLRDGAESIISYLHARGLKTHIISGDNEPAVKRAARAAGIPQDQAHATMTPQRKIEQIKAAQNALVGETRSVVMVGDGVNDSLALAAADIGIGISGGLQSMVEVCDIYLTGDPMILLKNTFANAMSVTKTITLALMLSLSYNLVGSILAIFGVITPLIAAIAMPISSLTVLAVATSSRDRGSTTLD